MNRRQLLSWSSVSLLAAVSGALAASPVAADRPQAAQLQDVLLGVSVNGGPPGEPVALLRGAGGAIYVPEWLLAEWRLHVPAGPALNRDGVRYARLDYLDGIRLAVDEAAQSLAITADPRLLEPTRLSYAAVDVGEEVTSGTGAFVNYDLSAELAGRSTALGGAVEAGVFTARGVGITNVIGRWSRGGARVIRLDSNWTIDDPANLRSLRFGDAISRSGIGGVPLRFGGVQLARNFAVEPGFVTLPLPTLGGSAAVPSVVDIYVDNALRGSRDVPAGPFAISGLPVVSGNGDVELVVRDVLGREMLYRQSYYSAPNMLARGLHDYALEAGFLRRSFARKSNDYGALMLSGTERYGLTDQLTGEAHAEATPKVQAAGVGAALALGGVGLVELRLAGSHSERGLGQQVGFSLERRTRALSFGVTAEASSADYLPVGLGRDRRPPASVVQAFAGAPTPFGSVGLSYVRRDGRSEPDVEYAGANTSIRIGRLGSLHLAGRKELTGGRDLAAELFFVMPLGGRASASAGAAFGPEGPAFTTGVQRSLPVGEGFGYRFEASHGTRIDRFDGKLSLQTGFGVYDAQLTWVDGSTGVRLSTSGGFGMIGGDVFASRRLDQSFAAVTVGEYPGVRVYADNQLVGRTDRTGKVIVPRLRAFDRNKLTIELADLPLDAEVTDGGRVVRPAGRHGIAVAFAAHPALAAIVPMILDDGSALPAGAAVTLAGQKGEWVSAPGGGVYLTGLSANNAGIATWSTGRCAFRFAFAASGDAQARLERVTCRRIGG